MSKRETIVVSNGTARTVSLIFSIAAIVGMVAVTILHYTALDSGVFYRAVWLVLHGLGATATVAAARYEEIDNIRLAFVLSAAAALAGIVLVIFEWVRDAACPLGVTQLDVAICAASPTLSVVWPALATAITALLLLNAISTFAWMSNRSAALLEEMMLSVYKKGLQDKKRTSCATTLQMASLLRKKRTKRVSKNGFRIAIGIFLTLNVLFIGITSAVFPRSGAFYRGALAIVPAHFAGALLAYVGRPSVQYWRWVGAAFGILSLVTGVTALVIEWPRFARCLSGTFASQIERDICVQGGVFLSVAMPAASSLLVLLCVLGVISVLRRA